VSVEKMQAVVLRNRPTGRSTLGPGTLGPEDDRAVSTASRLRSAEGGSEGGVETDGVPESTVADRSRDFKPEKADPYR